MFWATICCVKGGNNYGVSFEDVPGCTSAGDTLEEAIAMGHEALSLHLRGMADDGDVMPVPSFLDDVKARATAEACEPGETLQFVPIVGPVLGRSRAVRLNICLQARLLADLDRWAAQHGETRSAVIADGVRRVIAL